MKSVEEYPEYQGDPNNIQFLTRAEHLAAHDGYFVNPTNGRYDPATGKTTQLDENISPIEPMVLQNPINPEDAEVIAQLNDLDQDLTEEDIPSGDTVEELNHLEHSEENENTVSQKDAETTAATEIDNLSSDSSGEESGDVPGADNGASESSGEGVSM